MKQQRWKPKEGQRYWLVNLGYWSSGNIAYEYYTPDSYEKRLYNAGNMFKTKKEAIAKLKLIKKGIEEMTRQEFAELLSGDKQIQTSIGNGMIGAKKWCDINWKRINPDVPIEYYRHKPEPKYRPYTPEEVLLIIEKSLRETKDYPIFINTSDNKEFRVVGVNNNCIIARDKNLEYAHIKLSNILTLWYAWKDGSPCGVEVAE